MAGLGSRSEVAGWETGVLRFNLKGAKKLLFLGAHSDDIEIGCGGTILALTEAYSGLKYSLGSP